jgi:hypothetical protein
MRLCRNRSKEPFCRDIVTQSSWAGVVGQAPCPSVEKGDGRASMPYQREKVSLASCHGFIGKSPDVILVVNREFVLPLKKV